MAKKKKKAVKKSKKKAAKKTAKRRKRKQAHPVYDPLNQGPARIYMGYTEMEARCLLQEKILKISEDHPIIEATGELIVGQGESFKFTIYHDVRKVIDPLLIKHKLTFKPYADAHHQATMGCDNRGWHWINTHYALTDAETGYREIIPGQGLGENRFWAIDSANTLAIKHALLLSLQVRWDNRTAMDAALATIRQSAPELVGACIKGFREAVEQSLEKFDWKGHADGSAERK